MFQLLIIFLIKKLYFLKGVFMWLDDSVIDRNIVLIFHVAQCLVVWRNTFFLLKKKKLNLFFATGKISIIYGNDRNAKFLSSKETKIFAESGILSLHKQQT